MAGVAQLVEGWIVIPCLPSNISNLAPKTMQTKCRQIERRDMEKWQPHPTRENIFINQEDGFMYERISSGLHNFLPGQKMTELQELESLRKADEVAAITSRSQEKFNQSK